VRGHLYERRLRAVTIFEIKNHQAIGAGARDFAAGASKTRAVLLAHRDGKVFCRREERPPMKARKLLPLENDYGPAGSREERRRGVPGGPPPMMATS
jgi:hypothetical protein